MSIVTMQRAAYQRPNVALGNRNKPRRIASDGELHKINKAIMALDSAKSSTSEPEFLVKLSDAMKIARDLWRGRNDV